MHVYLIVLYAHALIYIGLLFQPPPTLPTHYIERPKLLQEITEKVLTTEIDNTVHITVVITGMAGFGKSTIAVALCHQQLIKKHFPNGFLRIQLGLTPKTKYYMLSQVYRALTGNTWTNPTSYSNPQGAVSEDDMVTCLSEELNTLCKKNPGLLVIIDDVWDVEDATDYVKIFSGCKIVLTTRRKDVASSINCKHKICVDSMELSEAIQLLIFNIKELQINNSDVAGQLSELAMNLHNWPLLLNLVRGQLYIHCKSIPNSPFAVIKQVTKKLYDNGLTAFDPKRPKRQNAVDASIKASLDLLSEENVTRLNRLVTSAVFGYTIPKQILMYMWKLSNEKVDECCNDLWSVGLISYGSLLFDDASIEIHLVITQYVFDNVKIDNIFHLTLNTFSDLNSHMQFYGMLYQERLIESHDESRFGFWFIDTLDMTVIPVMLYKIPMISQQAANMLHSSLKVYFDIQEVQKQSFMRVKDKYKIILSYLNDGKRDQAIDLIIEAHEKSLQYFSKIVNYVNSLPKIPFALRNSFECLVSLISSVFPQMVKNYVNTRSAIYNLIVSKTFSLVKMVEILETGGDKSNEMTVSVYHEFSTLIQAVNYDNSPMGYKIAADLLLPFQSSNSNVDMLDYVSTVNTYISQHQKHEAHLSDASCSIS